jgi:hypothetical protein
VWTKNKTRAEMPPAAKDFWLPLFMYPITPPTTEVKKHNTQFSQNVASWQK